MTSRGRWRSAGPLLVLGMLLLTWGLAIGRYGGPDEPAHVLRAAAVADGQVQGDPATGMAAGFRLVRVPTALATGDPACYRHDPAISAACAGARAAPGTTTVATAAGINPPWYYAMVGVPVRLLGQTDDTTWYRVVAIGWNLLVLALVGFRLRRLGATPWGWLAVATAITPAAWFLFGVVNPNGLEVALLLLSWVSLIPLLAPPAPAPGGADVLASDPALVLGVMRPGVRDESRPDGCTVATSSPYLADVAWASVPAAAAVLIRPIAVLPVVAAAVVLAIHTTLLRHWTWRARGMVVAPVVVAGGLTAAWNAWTSVVFVDPRAAVAESHLRSLRTALGGLGDTAREMVGSLGWAEFGVPPIGQFAWWLGAAGLAWAAMRHRTARQRWAVLAWLLVLVAGPVVFETFAAARVGHIWQGRYSIPTLLGLAALASVPGPSTPPERLVRRWWWVLAGVEVAAFWASLHRATVGTRGSWWFAGPASALWDPVLPALVLLAANALLAATLAAGAIRRCSRTGR